MTAIDAAQTDIRSSLRKPSLRGSGGKASHDADGCVAIHLSGTAEAAEVPARVVLSTCPAHQDHRSATAGEGDSVRDAPPETGLFRCATLPSCETATYEDPRAETGNRARAVMIRAVYDYLVLRTAQLLIVRAKRGGTGGRCSFPPGLVLWSKGRGLAGRCTSSFSRRQTTNPKPPPRAHQVTHSFAIVDFFGFFFIHHAASYADVYCHPRQGKKKFATYCALQNLE